MDDDVITQRRVPANGAKPPQTSAPTSVFDAGTRAKAAARPPEIALDKIVIRKGVPKPDPLRVRDKWNPLISRMAPGDSVELPLHQAKNLYSACKKVGEASKPRKTFSVRTINATTGAVWRDT